MVKEQTTEVENQGEPVCEKCGSVLIDEDGEMVCPECNGEIDFFGDDEEDEELV